jgi:glycosyltransferase involved in cell wall biosynthesis
VVIPTLNEEEYLPHLLESLTRQTWPIHEVIVADAGSQDETVGLARRAGAILAPGGHPGVGRNEGARLASGDWLLFLDADTRLEPDALETAAREMERRGLDGASCWFVPDSRSPFLRLNHWASCHYFRLSTWLRWPHSIGAFLLVRRRVHETLGGFDTTITVAEDQDYVRRLSRAGRYDFLRRPVVEIAARRFQSRGSVITSLKWLGIEAHRLFMGEIRGSSFRYFD